MKVILLKDIKNVGDENEIVDVSEGYARNYLLPKKLAVIATPTAIADLERNRKKIEQKLEAKKKSLIELAKKLEETPIELYARVGENNKLFGSITAHDVAEAIKQKFGVDLDKRKIHLEQHIKTLGTYQATIKLLSEVEAKVQILVLAENKQ